MKQDKIRNQATPLTDKEKILIKEIRKLQEENERLNEQHEDDFETCVRIFFKILILGVLAVCLYPFFKFGLALLKWNSGF